MFEKFLKSIGVDAKTISELAKAVKDSKDDLDITSYVDDFKTTQKKLLENDPDLVKGIAAKEKGKILDMVTRDVKKAFNLDSALIKDKDIDEVIAIAKAESVKSLSKDIQTVQQENTELTAKIKEYEDVKFPALKTEVENEKKEFKILTALQKKIPVKDLRNPLDFVEEQLVSKLKKQYDLDLDDKGEPIIFSKGSKLQVKSADGTKLLTLDDAMMDILKQGQFIKESNAEDGDASGKKKEIQPAKVTTDDGKGGQPAKQLPPHILKAQQHAESLKKPTAKT